MEILNYVIGNIYKLKLGGSYYRVTLMDINHQVDPPQAHVIIREHSVDSFENHSTVRTRHKRRGEAVPCTDVSLTELKP